MNLKKEILSIIFSFRRLLPNDPCRKMPCGTCFNLHIEKIKFFVDRQMPIQIALPGFPSKSPSPAKVLSHLPDTAEQVALEFLAGQCRRIQQIYSPGVELIICSDGRVFSPIDRVSDEQVSDYSRVLEEMIRALRSPFLSTFSLEDVFNGTHNEIRNQLLLNWGPTIEELRSFFKNNDPLVYTFRGIRRFIFEELVVLDRGVKSRTTSAKESKEIAYQVVQRSQAWSELVEHCFPRALRLSIHPQQAHSPKIGIHLVPTLDNWLTPWHGVAVKVGSQFHLMKRWQAESIGARLVFVDGRPSHFAYSGDSPISSRSRFIPGQ